MENLFNQKVINAESVFAQDYIDANMLYLYRFNRLPSVHFLSGVDSEKAFAAIQEQFAGRMKEVLKRRWYKRESRRFAFDNTIVVFDNECLLELDASYCEILHNGQSDAFVTEVSNLVLRFRERQRREPLEINLVVNTGRKLELRAMEIKRTRLSLGLFYEDDFAPVDELIRKRLRKKNDKGIVLLHGLPGTGKTTYLRYLVGRIRKRVLFLSPAVAGNLLNPEFIDLLVENPNTVLIIEDAENIIMDRRFNSGSSVSNLLNISDGLLADFLNVQLICTFNSAVTMVDSALLRKGRLIARYEFGRLSVEKSRRLSRHLGVERPIDQPMTIAEIANPEGLEQPVEPQPVIGFRRALEGVNGTLAGELNR